MRKSGRKGSDGMAHAARAVAHHPGEDGGGDCPGAGAGVVRPLPPSSSPPPGPGASGLRRTTSGAVGPGPGPGSLTSGAAGASSGRASVRGGAMGCGLCPRAPWAWRCWGLLRNWGVAIFFW